MTKRKFLIASLLIAGWSFGCGDDSASNTGKTNGDGCNCSGEQVCVDKVCYEPGDLCNGVKCGDSQTCVDNVCKDKAPDPVDPVEPEALCGGEKCGESQVCKADKCVEKSSLCGDAVCSDSQACIGGQCLEKSELCGETVCNDVQACHEGECVDKDKVCGDAVCTSEQACQDGACVAKDKICGTSVCTDSQTCRDSQCVANDKICGSDVCSDAQTCVTGQCVDPERICGDSVCSASQSCHEGECVASDMICGETVCKDLQVCVENVCQDPKPAQILAVVDGAPTVSEDGTSVGISVSLATKPTADVQVAVISNNTNEVAIAPETLTFTAENWDTPQMLTATGVDDNVIDGSVKSMIVMTSASTDSAYEGLGRQIEITTEDNDIAAIKVVSNGISISESREETEMFTVVLTAQPTADVVITLASSDKSELEIDGATTLTFTKDNWNVSQVVTVKPVDDQLADGAQSVYVTLKSASEDANFNNLEAQTETYVITDDEAPGLVLSAASSTLTPAAAETEITVSLTTEPTADVTVTVMTSNNKTAALSEMVLTFTLDNWNTPQKVTVSNTDPMSASSVVSTETITAKAESDGAYNNLMSNEIALKIYAMTAIDVPKARTCEMQKFSLLPGKYKLEAWGAQGGSDGPGGGKPGHVGGKGGYAAGIIELTEPKDIYVMVGEYSLSFNTYPGVVPCNGGGVNSGGSTGAGGGGATHFAATELGALANYENSKSDVYLVAGGGGGAGDYAEGGAGGGESGGNGVGTNSGVGATQTTGYKFGAGEPASGQNPGGGGGWFGGKRSNGGVNAGGGGGSGYIGGVTNGEMVAGVQDGDGKAKITVVD